MLERKQDQHPQKRKPYQEYKVAHYGFKCPITGLQVIRGSNYIERDGFKMSIAGANMLEQSS